MEKGYAVAKLKPGIIGVVINIMKSDAGLPDKIKDKELLKREEKEEVETAEEKVKEEKEIKEITLAQIPEITPFLAKKLATANINTLAKLEETTIENLMTIKGVGKKTAESLKKLLKEIEKKQKGGE
jgi:ERCC4-type nuclease